MGGMSPAWPDIRLLSEFPPCAHLVTLDQNICQIVMGSPVRDHAPRRQSDWINLGRALEDDDLGIDREIPDQASVSEDVADSDSRARSAAALHSDAWSGSSAATRAAVTSLFNQASACL